MMPNGVDTTLLRKTVVDVGFDIGPDSRDGWLRFRAAGNLATVWVTEIDRSIIVAVAPEQLATEIKGAGFSGIWTGDKPAESWIAWRVRDRLVANELLRRIIVLGRILPDQVLHKYNSVVAAAIERMLSESPLERVVEVRQRVGQDLYREALMEYWNGKCAITGIGIPLFLRASHAKPWRDATDRERLDVHNGLLLVANLDIAFDKGFISVADDGSVVVSPSLSMHDRMVLGMDTPKHVSGLRKEHTPYLHWHRERIFIE
jgi:putative restriction endonuclease